MSRKQREIKKNFKVFCEGDTEYHYIDEMRREKKLSIALKLINMKGGGYKSFLEAIRADANTNCLAKFIIIDGDKAASGETEKENLEELLQYCILQNKIGKAPHILIVNDPDFEYVGCLHDPSYKGQDIGRHITKVMGYKDIDSFKSDKNIYRKLHSNGNSSDHMLAALQSRDSLVENKCKVYKNRYEMKVKTVYYMENLGKQGSNFHDYFDVLNKF